MKDFLLLILILNILPAFSQSKNDFIEYDSMVVIDKTNAKEIKTFINTPESIVTYFYASKIRNDKKWKNALPVNKSRAEQVNASVEEYKKWTFKKFNLVSRANYKENIIFIKIYLEVIYKGGLDSGTSTIQLENIDGTWTITRMPK